MSQRVAGVPPVVATGEPEGLNMVESELGVLVRQCLKRRIPDIKTLEKEVWAWEYKRNKNQVCANWRFCTEDARVKLSKIYPTHQN